MKKFIVLALAVILIGVAVPGAQAEYWNEGNYGYSEETAYVIDSVSDLITLRDRVRSGTEPAGVYYRLETDIDLSEYRNEWKPINPFKGHFNGNGHTIYLKAGAYSLEWDYVAKRVEYGTSLFGNICTEDGYAVKNLTVSGHIFSRYWGAGIATDIVKDSNASIENCKFTGTIHVYTFTEESYCSDAGGIVCYLSGGTVKNCTVEDAEIEISIWKTGPKYGYKVGGGSVGGIAAKMTGGTIEGCTLQQNVSIIIATVDSDTNDSIREGNPNTTHMGGIVGLLDSGTVKTVKNNVSYPVIGSRWAIGAGAIAGKISDYSGVNIADNIYTGSSHGIGYGPGGSGDDRGCVNAGKITLTITTASFPSGNIGDYYSESLTATTTGGTWPVTWALTSGTLPAGFTLNADGTISGSPTAKGTYKFTVKASIGSSGIISATKEYTITIADNQPSYSLTVKNESLSNGTVGKSYSETLRAELTGAELPATWSYTGTLPPGLTLNTSGTITGTPTKAGEYTFTVKAVFGAFEGTKDFTVKITAGGDTELPEAEDDIAPEFKAHQPDLDGIIVVNFYAYMPEISGVNYSNSYVNFKILNDTSYNPTQEYDPSFTAAGKLGTYYGFRCCVTSVQMADPITATLHYGNGLTVEHTYKLTDYLDKYYYASTTPELLKNVVGAMKDYGHYAQIALAEVNGWTIGKDHLETNAANVYTDSDIEETREAVEDYAKSWNVGNSGIKSIGYRLALDADTIIELFIRPNDDYNGNVSAYSRGVIGITDTSANIAVKQSDGRYLVQISGIPAHRLDYTNVIRVVTDKGEFDVKVSALSYVNTILNSEKYNDNMKKAVTSLYKYYKAARAYWENNNQ